MGKLNIFTITLDNPMGVYNAGGTVQGYVTVELNQPMTMRGIRLNFRGEADVHWTERHSHGSGKNRRTTTHHYRAHETYFDQSLVLYGKAKGQGGDNPEHPLGRYTYQFSLLLPPNLPSSFEGAHGNVRYQLKANIDRPWKFDHKTKKPFSVISNLDLNLVQDVLTPRGGSDEKTICCLCCASGPIEASMTIDRYGYVPGEYITITGEINNCSSRTMDNVDVVLTQHIGFHATNKSRWVTKKVGSVSKGEVEPGGRVSLTNMGLHIPPLPPSHLVGCNIIDIKYILTLIVDPSGPATDLEVPLEVIIGTIPLRNVMASYGYGVGPPPEYGMSAGPFEYGGGASVPSAPPPIMLDPSAPALPPPSNMPPPPSYAECVFGKVDIKEEDDGDHSRGDLSYAPVYTYYSWDQPPPGGPEK